MKIVVLVKHAPGASAKPSFAADHTTDRVRVDGGLSAIDAYAVEQALRLAESGPGAEVTFVTMGPARAIEALHKGQNVTATGRPPTVSLTIS